MYEPGELRVVAYKDGKSPFVPYVEATVGCVRIGVVGLVTGSYGSDDQPSDQPLPRAG